MPKGRVKGKKRPPEPAMSRELEQRSRVDAKPAQPSAPAPAVPFTHGDRVRVNVEPHKGDVGEVTELSERSVRVKLNRAGTERWFNDVDLAKA